MDQGRHVLIVAGGLGVRLGGEPKQFRLLGGRPLLMLTLEAYHRACDGANFFVVLPRAYQKEWDRLCAHHKCEVAHKRVAGGASRSESVSLGLAAIAEAEGLVAIHDGVRPFLRASVLQKAFEVAQKEGSAVPVVAVADSIRELADSGTSYARDRSRYCCVQTPQVFRLSAIRKAFAATKGIDFQDEAARMEAAIGPIQLIDGDPLHFKITTPYEWQMAQAYVRIQGLEGDKD